MGSIAGAANEETALFDLTCAPTFDGRPGSCARLGSLCGVEGDGSSALRFPMPVARPMRVTYWRHAHTPNPPWTNPAGGQLVTQHLSGGSARLAVLDSHAKLAGTPEGMPPCVLFRPST